MDEAWRRLAGELADALVAMDEDDVLVLAVRTGVDEDDLAGCTPYVQAVAYLEGDGAGEGAGEPWVRAEASSDQYLDDRFLPDLAGDLRLEGLGWHPPTWTPGEEPDEGSSNWWCDAEVREADLVAHRMVTALREVFGCPHPTFLDVRGDVDLPSTRPDADALDGADDAEPDEPLVVMPTSAEELLELVGDAFGPLERAVVIDAEWVAVQEGRSELRVRPMDDEPTLELSAVLVRDLPRRARAAAEVEAALLNRDLLFGRVVVRDDRVLFHHALCALPFSPLQVRLVVGRILSDLDERAAALVQRLGGRRALDDSAPRPAPAHLTDALVAEQERPTSPPGERPGRRVPILRQLLEAGAADPRAVATVYDGDLGLLARDADRLRDDPPADLDVADALAALREAVVWVVQRRARTRWSSGTRPTGRRTSRQDALPAMPSESGPQGSLDLGEG